MYPIEASKRNARAFWIIDVRDYNDMSNLLYTFFC